MSAAPRHTTLQIPPDHPMYAGHFPARPIVPGAWLLAQAISALEAQEPDGGFDWGTLKSVKFLGTVAPGAVLELVLAGAPGDVRRLEIRCAGRLVLVATINGPSP